MKELVAKGTAHNIKSAKKMVERLQTEVWDVLEEVIKEHPVMLNRAPTLHRLGIQAFEPVLVEGKAIKLHPLVCTAYNADFDGDQMAVHLPLSVEAQAECRFLLLSPNNLLKPSDGAPVTVPSQDMVLGIYYLTIEREMPNKPRPCFKSLNEAILAYENSAILLHEMIKVRRSGINKDGEIEQRTIESTLGRFIFNEIIPQDLGFVDRSVDENFLTLEINFLVGKKQLKPILEKCINIHGSTKTAEILDAVKSLGYKYSTRAAMTVSISDMEVPVVKQAILADAEETIENIAKEYRRGRMTEEERYNTVIETWKEADKILTEKLLSSLDKFNNIKMMSDSGARGSDKQIKQLAGMRGLMADTSGRTIELPIKSNLREGLDVLEYFISAHGARKGLSDTALRTADSGYLTRRLVDVSQDLIIREVDCQEGKEIPGMWIKAFEDGKEVIEGLEERITGRYSCESIYDADGEMIVKANHMITPKRAARIMATGVDKIKIRNVLSCKSHIGVCAKCYGANMATGEAVQVGEAVGIIAAQSIGEPGTQLTMRTFHTGGVAGDDITQGLPRVEELFEARKPKGLAIIAEFGGVVTIKDTKKKREVIVTNNETMESKAYLIPYGSRIKVVDNDIIEAGDELTEGSVNPHDILKIKGIRAVQDYMIQEVQRVYRLQGVEINDKHIEVIVRQMLKKVRIETNGDTAFLPGTLIDILEYEDENEKMVAEGLEAADGKQVMLGITKASLATNSFLSAASFQETTKVLTEAAIKGKVDPLIGLKENVIIGKLIPAGTGMKRYRSVKLDTDTKEEYMLSEDIEGDGAYLGEYNEFEYSDDSFGDDEYFAEEYDEDGVYEGEDGIAEIVYSEEKYAHKNDLLQREDSIPGVDDAHVGYGENSHNDGDWTETEFNLKGISEDDYSDGL
jgi:DNA-directed RNA polymerase subunit beta'